MCRKSPAIIYVYKKINTTRKSDFNKQLNDSPLTSREIAFMKDIADGLTIAQLSEKFNLSPPRISSWKQEVCKKLQQFDMTTMR